MKKLLIGCFIFLFSAVLVSQVQAGYHNRGRSQEVREEVKTKSDLVKTQIEERKITIQQRVEELKQHQEALAQERKLEIRERQATKRAEIASKVAELKARVIENIKAVFLKILDRMIAAHDRLDKIVDKIESRIAKLKEKGVNTEPAESALAACADEEKGVGSAIDDAKAKIASIDSKSTKVPDAVHTANSSLRTAKRALQNYHKCLVDVIRTLRARIPAEATPGGATESAQ